MALQLSKTLDNGFIGNYIRATSITIDADNDIAIVGLCLYVDAAGRTAGNQPVSLDHISMTAADFTGVSTDWQTVVYNHVKTLTDYSGAIDV